MGQFPQLNQEDIDHLDAVLRELLKKSEANIALLVEKAGYLIHQSGNPEQNDTTTFATLRGKLPARRPGAALPAPWPG